MSSPKMKVVGPDDPPSRRLTIAEAAFEGDRMLELQAMRMRIADALDDPNTMARDLASLSRRLMEIGTAIEALEVERDEAALAGADVPDEAWTAI